MVSKLDLEARMSIKKLTEHGVANTEVAAILGVTEGAVRYHRRRQVAAATDGRSRQECKASAHHEAIVFWLGSLGRGTAINLADLHRWLIAEHDYDGSQRSVERYFKKAFPRPAKRARRRVETPPGAQAQLDWSEHRGVLIADAVVTLYAFHLRLSFSRHSATVWSRSKTLLSWLACHNEALRRIDGVPATMRIDNEKTAVVQGAGPWGTIHPIYQRYAQTLRFHVDACLPRSPQHKGKVERGIRDFRPLIDLKGRHWNDLEELQALTDERTLAAAKKKICPATGLSVIESFEIERAKLAPLPILPEPFDLVATRQVGIDCMVAFEGAQYSAPFCFVGRKVEIRGCADKVQIVAEGEIVAEHGRCRDRRIVIDPTHFEGPSTEQVRAPMPLGRMGRRLMEIAAMDPERRPVDLYAALAEAAR